MSNRTFLIVVVTLAILYALALAGFSDGSDHGMWF